MWRNPSRVNNCLAIVVDNDDDNRWSSRSRSRLDVLDDNDVFDDDDVLEDGDDDDDDNNPAANDRWSS